MHNKIRACILSNEIPSDHMHWVKACEDYKDLIEFYVVDLTCFNWFEKITSKKFDIFLAKPSALSSHFKQLYDERIRIIDTVLTSPIYPSSQEIYIYENKRFLYSWLKANNLPHPNTHIFYRRHEAESFVQNSSFPIVAKTSIGASGSGVKILKDKTETYNYIKNAFSPKGIAKRWGPNFSKGKIFKRGLHYIFSPSDINNKVKKYNLARESIQQNFVIFQEFIPHEFEWRIVAIGDSYFAHKKLKINDKASGSTLKKYDNPPIFLFEFAKNIMDRFNFTSQAIDVFLRDDGKILINELQCIFGQSDKYQMLVNNIPGRYISKNNKWVFEKGLFNKNESYNLRVKHFINILSK